MKMVWEYFCDFWKLIFYGIILYFMIVMSIFIVILILGGIIIWIIG
jgi:hypothetical protein